MKIFKIVLLSLLAAVLVFVLLAGTLVTDGRVIAENLFYINTPQENVALEQIMSTEYDAEEVESIEIDLKSEDVHIFSAEEGNIVIRQYGSSSDLSVETYSKDGVLKVTSPYDIFNGIISEVDLGIPKDFKGKLVVNTLSGDVTINDINAGYCSIKTDSGFVSMANLLADNDEEFAAGNVEIESVSGNIDIADVICKIFKVSTTSGDMSLWRVRSGDINVNSVSGDTWIETSEQEGKIDVDTVSGDVDIILPEGSSADAILDTTSGDMKCNGVMLSEKSELKISVASVSGDMYLTSAEYAM